MRAWRHQQLYFAAPERGGLQFGHAGEGVETCGGLPEDGKRYTVLQFGHAGEGVETATDGKAYTVAELLQFGHAGEGVETCFPTRGKPGNP